MNYQIIRSKRKTLAIHITNQATVEVRVPLRLPQAEIDRFVNYKQDWITKHLEIKQQSIAQKFAFTLKIGEKLLLQGKGYPLTATHQNKIGFDGESFYVPQNLPPQAIKNAIIHIYKALAKSILTQKVHQFAIAMSIFPTAVKINSAKTRWGSCSSKNSLNFSWRLILAPDEVIDYVAVHELAHIKEHNHSQKFWDIVAAILPDYKSRQKQLKLLHHKLSKEDWE